MKIKITLLLYFAFSVFALNAKNERVTKCELKWKAVEKWQIDSSFVSVLAFEDAKYPAEDRLPYFTQRITCDPNLSYSAQIKNPVYIPLTTDEKALFVTNQALSSEAQLNSSILHQRETKYFEIQLFPFANKNGVLMKLQSFDLALTETSQPQKVKSSAIHTYAANSVLAQGKFVKVRIVNSGIYKLTYEDLVSMGVNPANVRVFGYGGNVLDQSFLSAKIDDLPEVAIYMNKGSDGVFNAGDYILFYGQGIVKWSYDSSLSMFTHTENTYSNYGYYFITSDAGVGKRIADTTITVPASTTVNPVEEFTDYQVHEVDLLNLVSGGKEFYGEPFNDVLSYTFPFSFPNPVLTNSTSVRLDVAASSSLVSNFNLSLNGQQNNVLAVSARPNDNYQVAMASNGFFKYTPQSSSFNFTLTYTKSAPTSVGYLNYLEVNARRKLTMTGSAMQFQNVDYLGFGLYSQYFLSAANSSVQIWDITDPQNISNIVTQTVNGKLSFTDTSTSLKNYLAIDPTASSAFPKPEVVGVVPNQNLHSITQADLVIITHPNFLSQAQTLAQAHQTRDNMTVAVVTTDQVYNEFSSGTPDATAYRWMMKMLYDRALNANSPSDLPKNLLLYGRGTYDNRKIRPESGDNLILTYQSDNSLNQTLAYVTDDYFALLNDNDGSQVPANLMDIGVGRFPVATSQQATDVMNKTIGYMNNQDKGFWKNRLCFLADDGDAALHMTQADSITRILAREYPAYQIEKLYMDAYLQEVTASGQSYPVAKTHLLNLIQSGLFLLDFTGHAGATGLTNEAILSINDVKNLTNTHLPLFIGATCDFLQFDVQVISGGEYMLLNPNGGSIGILSAALPVYASQNFTLNKLVCDNLFQRVNGKQQRLGDIISYAKNNVGTEINKLCYMFMGDPALTMNYPTKYNVVTNQVNQSTTLGNDTLRALSVATIKGFIADDNGNKVTNFNGTLHSTVFDKMQIVTTLNNEGDGALTYSDRPNTLFSGNADVKNGDFSFSFLLPKDIKYNFGSGRINYYAEDDINNFEAQGYFENFLIGGTSSTYNVNDTIGPAVSLYLNSENFVSGDKVNETPVLIANVSDIDGVNTVSSGIGHDITLTVDQDPVQTYIINDYFQASTNSYTDGVINYKLPTLQNGKHTLNLRVWDLLNNSTNVSTNFEVVKGLTPEIFTIYNYPNPVKAQTRIFINHDRPETILYTTVDIFDLTGRKIWSFTQSNADNITWNLIDNNGQKVKTGIYLYRVSIKTKNSDITSKTNKMLIVEQ